MSPRERLYASLSIFTLACFLIIDVIDDWLDGDPPSHLIIQSMLSVFALVVSAGLFARYWRIRSEFLSLQEKSRALQLNAQEWKAEIDKFIAGISQLIDAQFDRWHLTPAEREISSLLLKGLSLKEIADIRSVNERTVRQQTVQIYEKSGVSGRAELSAFFLEDLLPPLPSDARYPVPSSP